MNLTGNQDLLRIFINEADQWGGEPLYRVLVRHAREMGCAGATVLRGIMGFGSSRRLHDIRREPLNADLPVVVEIADRPDRIDAFLPFLDGVVGVGLLTRERVDVRAYRANPLSAPGRPPLA